MANAAMLSGHDKGCLSAAVLDTDHIIKLLDELPVIFPNASTLRSFFHDLKVLQ